MIVSSSARYSYFPLLSLLMGLVFSCSKGNNEDFSHENTVTKISGTFPKTIDLTGRMLDDWKLSMGNYYYSYTIVESTIIGNAYEVGYSYRYPSTILFAPKDWRVHHQAEAPVIKSAPLSEPVFKNQDKIDSLLWSDILYAPYSGPKESEIHGLSFLHANALLDFEMNGFPEGASVKVTPLISGEYSPYRYDENRYQYVMMGSWWKPSHTIRQYIIVYINEDRYSIEVGMNEYNTLYEFTLKFDNLQKEISIEDLRESVWSDRNWPDH